MYLSSTNTSMYRVLCRSGKVVEFKVPIFQAWKALESFLVHEKAWKIVESHG